MRITRSVSSASTKGSRPAVKSSKSETGAKDVAPAAKKQKQADGKATTTTTAKKQPSQNGVELSLGVLNDEGHIDGDGKVEQDDGSLVCTAQGLAKLVDTLGSEQGGKKRADNQDNHAADLRRALGTVERLVYQPIKPYLAPAPPPSGSSTTLFPNLRQLVFDLSRYESGETWEDDEEEEARYLPIKTFVNLVGDQIWARNVCYTVMEDKENEYQDDLDLIGRMAPHVTLHGFSPYDSMLPPLTAPVSGEGVDVEGDHPYSLTVANAYHADTPDQAGLVDFVSQLQEQMFERENKDEEFPWTVTDLVVARPKGFVDRSRKKKSAAQEEFEDGLEMMVNNPDNDDDDDDSQSGAMLDWAYSTAEDSQCETCGIELPESRWVRFSGDIDVKGASDLEEGEEGSEVDG